MDISALLMKRLDTHTMEINETADSLAMGMPEHALIVEFLIRVILDLRGNRKNAMDARGWVADHDRGEGEPFSLRWCAEQLNVEWTDLQGFLLDVADGLHINDRLLNFTGIKNK